ncbi:MAG: PAS domain S-box protein [Cytophagaceae bacterium]|nr:PAS domain S-box protein [Gemmatimonadaceae bacterium]
MVDEDGRIVLVNKAWTEFAASNGNPGVALTGVGANYLDVARRATGPFAEEGEAAYLGIRSVLDGSLPQFTLEYPCPSPTQPRWFLLTVSPLAGTPAKALLSHVDITEQKTAQDDQARLAAIIECSDDAIVSITLDGIIVTWNHGAERLYGYSTEEMLGQSVSVLFTPEHYDEYQHIMRTVKKGQQIPAHDTKRLRKDGKSIDVSVSISPVLIRKGEVIGASKIAHDITRVKLLEEQFRQAQKMEAVGTLAGGVAHDFNNLLTIINAYSELLMEELPDGDPMRELLIEIHKAGERAGNLTRQLLAFSRKQILLPRVLDLGAIVTDTTTMLRRVIGEDIVLSTVLDPAARPVKVDPGQIQQILMNLAVNARDAMPQGGRLTIETRHVTIDEEYHQTHLETKPGHYSMIVVTDTGTGMDDATKARIFEPFFTTKGEGKGTGLGMAVVHGVVRQSGGMIEVYSEVDKGTAFKLYFPVAGVLASSVAPAAPGSQKMARGTETILLVEDDDAVRALSRHVLHSCGYTVLEASNGKEAITVAEGHAEAIHLMVTDVVMPFLGGRQLAERLEGTRPGLKALFLSGYTDDAVVRHGILQAEVAFLQKPFSPTALAQKVRDVLDRK